MLIPTSLKYEVSYELGVPCPSDLQDLSHNQTSNEANKKDPLCEQVGSLRGVADMLNLGALLLSAAPLEKFPKNMPLLVYHGEEDKICSPIASQDFVNGCQSTDKTCHIFPVSRAPPRVSKLITGHVP